MSRGFRAAFLSVFQRPSRLAAFAAFAAALACQDARAQTTPTVSGIALNDAGADNSYGTGDEIEASITFSEVVHVFEGEVAGVPRGQLHLLLAIGAATRQAQFCGGSGSTTLRFCYEVRSGDEDTDGISIGRLATALVDGVIESATGVAANRAYAAQAADATRLVDGVAPTPSTPTLNAPATGDTYGVGETIEATVTFNEAVNVIENNAVGQLQLALSIGENTRLANYATGSGAANLVFTYVVQADDEDIDGISIGPGARSLTGGGITDAAGNAAGRNFNALGQSVNHKVDGGSDFTGPTVTDVRVSSTPGAAGAYATDAVIEITVTFNEVVQVIGNPAITLTVGAVARSAAYHAGDGTTALVFRYTVQAGETDANGVSIPAGPAALAGGTIQDGAGNVADRTFAALADQRRHQVEATRPTVVGNVRITSSPSTGNTYVAGETITAEIVFNENIVATGAPALEIAVGSARRQATGARAATPTTMVFSYTVVAGDQDTDGITIAAGPGSLTGGVITDAVGNPASRAFAGLPTAQSGHRVDGGTDGVAPTVSAVRMDSNAGVDQTYALGDAIRVAIEFSEVVYVPRNARPQLTLSIGTPDSASAAYHDGSGTNTLIFRYVVVADDVDADGVSIGTLAGALTGGTIVDGAGNAAVRSHAGLAAQADHQVEARAPRITTTGPAVVIASDPDATGPDDDTYNRGDVIRITVAFDEVVHVTTPPQLAVTIGPATRQARYAAGSGTEVLEFRYTVQLGEVDADGISVNPNSLTGGRIQDAVGNPAVRTFAGLPAASEHLVDGGAAAVAPTVQTVRVSSNPNTGPLSLTPDTYAAGDNIEVEVTFDQIVHVSGSPAIILALGNRDQGAAYHRGSGTDTLTFRYPVREGDVDTDGIGIGPGPRALSGGAIVDSAGNAAVRAFTGLPRQDAHLVDATSPTVAEVRITSSPGPDNLYTVGESITGTVVFSEEVFADNAEIELLIGDSGASPVRRVPLTTGADRRVLHFTYAVQRGDSDDGVSIGPDGLVGGVIRDDAGNPARRTFAGLQHRGEVAGGQDNVAPTVLSVAAASDPGADYRYAAGDHIEVAVGFSEVVHVSGNPQLTLTVGAATRQAAYHRGGGTARLVFRHTVQSDEEDDDGIAIGTGPAALSGGGIHDSAGNAADRAFTQVGRLAGHRVDAVPPRPVRLAIVSEPDPAGTPDDNTYNHGDVIRFTVEFDDEVQVAGAPNLAFDTGNGTRQARYESDANTDTLTFEYTVPRGEVDTDGISVPANALSCGTHPATRPLPCIRDVVGNLAPHNAAGPLAADPGHRVDGGTYADGPFISVVRPVSNPGADQTYAVGDTIEVEVHFRRSYGLNTPVVGWPVFASGSPTLTLLLGSRSRPAALVRGSGTSILTFAYTVEPGDSAPSGFDYPAHPDPKLVGGTIVDAGGNAAYRVFRVRHPDPGRNAADAAELARHKVDGVAPRVASVVITSDPGADDTYKRGEDILVEVRFSKPLRVTDTPNLTLDLVVGERRRTARRTASTPSANPTAMTFAYTVQDGDADADGVSIPADAFRGGEITDVVGNAAILGGVALPDQAGHLVDGVAAGAVATITSDPGADQAYGIGDAIVVEVLFDQPLGGDAPQQLLIQVGTATHAARLTTARERLLTFEYVVQEGDLDTDGISIAADALRRGAEPAGVSLAPLGNQAGHRVDAVPPGAARVTIESTPNRNQIYRAGEVIEVHVAFNEPVWVDANPRLRLSIGSRTPGAAYHSGSGSAVLEFRYTVQSGDFDDDGISIGANALIDGAITDGAGNVLDADGRRLQPLRAQPAHKVNAGNDDTDNQPPFIESLRITSTPRVGDTYAAGETIEVQVIFSEAANVLEIRVIDGQIVNYELPVLQLQLGCSGRTVSRSARLAPGDDASDTLTFRYTTVDGDCDDDGVSIPADSLTGGRIVDYSSAANEAIRGHDALPSMHKVDGVTPRPTGPPEITSTPRRAQGYGVGEPIVVRVPFSEPIYVAGEPTLRLTIGRAARDALFTGVEAEEKVMRFQYVVQSGDGDDDGVSIGPDALSGGAIQDAVGNTWTDRVLVALRSDDAHRVAGGSDFLPPVVTNVRFSSLPPRGQDAYGRNDAIDVEATFTEPVFIVAGTPAMRLSIGANSRSAVYLTGDGTRTLTFRYVVQADDSDPDGISIGPNAIFGGTLRDGAGNEAALGFVGLPQDAARKVNPRADRTAPSLVSVWIESRAGGPGGNTYGLDDTIELRMRFNERVQVIGQPAILLSIGANNRPATYANGSGTAVLVFRYRVQPGDLDEDGISVAANTLTGGTLQDFNGNTAAPAFGELRQAQAAHRVDARRPAAEGMPSITSTGPYGIGATITVEVRFNEVVHVTGDPVLTLSIGAASRPARYTTGSGSDTLLFTYQVQGGDIDLDGISIGPDALVGGVIEDIAGNDWGETERRLPDLPNQSAHVVNAGVGVNTEAPYVQTVRITSTPDRGAYRLGEIVVVRAWFNETVWVPEGVAAVRLQVGPAARRAELYAGSGSNRLSFRYTVQAGDVAEGGISIGPSSLSGRIVDESGNEAIADFTPLPANPLHKVDAVLPSALDVMVISTPLVKDVYGLGEVIRLRVDFNERVWVEVDAEGREPTLLLDMGRATVSARFVEGSGTTALLFHYIVRTGDFDQDGIAVNADPLRAGTIRDRAGNELDEASRRVRPLPAQRKHKVNSGTDIDPPFVQDRGVRITSTPDNSAYALGEIITVEIAFSEVVHVSGQPSLALSVGPNVRPARYASGSGTSNLTFAYTVQAGDVDNDGISIGPGPATLTGGAIRDDGGNPANRDFAALPANGLHKVDAVAPAIAAPPAITSSPDNSAYALGEIITVQITFSDVVHVSGQPSLALSIGPNVRPARYASGSGTSDLTFAYTVQAGDVDNDGISIGPGPAALTGGAIRDDSGNPANRDFAALPANELHQVDAVAPAIAAPPVISSAPSSDAYRIGEVIELRVTFDDNVWASADPTLAVRVGDASREATLAGGSGTATLVFRYTVQEGDLDEDGISVATDALRGGTITDDVGNAAARAMPPLEPQAKHTVDGVVATASVAIASTPETGDTYRADEDINVHVTFSETVEVAAHAGLKLALTVGSAVREAAFVRRNEDQRTLAFRYTVAYGDIDADGVSVQGDALTGGTLTDRAGNPVRRALALGDQAGHKVDTSVTLELVQVALQVGGPPAQLNLTDVLAYAGLYNQPVSSDANVAVARISGHRLTISPVAEGNAVVTVTAQTTAQIVVNIPVVVTASPAEVAVLKQTLAAMGRGVLASAAHTIGSRLELGPRQRRMSLLVGGRRFDPQAWDEQHPHQPTSAGFGPADRQDGFGGDFHVGPAAPGIDAASPHHRAGTLDGPFGGGFGGGQAWRNTAFEMPLLGVGGGGSWSLWGGGDFSSFAGEPDENAYEGNLSAAYIGMDGRGPGWVAGGAVGRVSADASYEYKDANSAGKGNVETTLTTFHPYVGWSPSEKGKAWVILGVGRGEASMRRDEQQYDATPTDLSMRMGLVGARGVLGDPGGFDLAVRADAGTLTLETGDGAKAIDALAVAVQRVRLGVEMSYTADRGPVVGGVRLSGAGGGAGAFTPFVELAARFDGGDDQGGTGAEVAAGVRYQSTTVSFEAKARTLAMHGAEGYSETGASAALVVAPNGTGGRGLRLSVSPRWGGAAEATDVFFRRDYAAQAARRHNAGAAFAEWRTNARVEYGMGLRGRAGTVTPFAETDLSGERGERARLGFSYETKARHGAPVRFQVSGERVRDARGVEHRLLIGAEGRF